MTTPAKTAGAGRRSPTRQTRSTARSSRPRGHVKDKPTIAAVAERARVAVSTVSRVLNSGYASATTKRRVQRAIRELGYAPSVTARSLVTGRTGCVGVVAHSSQSPWFSQILAGIEEQLAHSSQSVLLASLMLKGRYDSSAVSAWIQEHRVDGLIFIRYTRREHPLFKAAFRAGLPVVLISPDIAAPASFIVRCKNVEAGRLVAAHLASLGHRRIAFAGGPQDSIDARDRLKGLRTELLEHKVIISDRNVWFGPSYDPEAGVEYAHRFLRRQPRARPTAVVLGNDAMALGFMRTVLRRGLHIPRDVSVVGFDDIADGALYWPGLTTVSQPTTLMGAAGCQALLERVTAPAREHITTAHYTVGLVVRESTEPARREGQRSVDR